MYRNDSYFGYFLFAVTACGSINEKAVAPNNNKLISVAHHDDSSAEVHSESGTVTGFHSDFSQKKITELSTVLRPRQTISKKTLTNQQQTTDRLAWEWSVVERHAPIFVHQQGHNPSYDQLRRMDFDGDLDVRNNVNNAASYDTEPYVYGQFLAETPDAYYLLYVVYHVRDYDTPLREFMFASAAHDNDLEGLVLMVSKREGVVAAETWYHSILLQFTRDLPSNKGLEVVDGKLHLEDTTHPYMFVQHRGHGVRAMQSLDLNTESFAHAVFYRANRLDQEHNLFAERTFSYTLLNFNQYLQAALSQQNPMFANYQPYLGGNVQLPLFLAGPFHGNSAWARPKPPWNWNSKADDFTGGALYFHPALIFTKHLGKQISTTYLHHRPLELAFSHEQAITLRGQLSTNEQSWFCGEKQAYLGTISANAERTAKMRRQIGMLIQGLFYWFG